MKHYEQRTCSDCGTNYKPTGPAARYCCVCSGARSTLARKRATEKHQRMKLGDTYGTGSGGQQEGASNHQWKGGVASYRKFRSSICERCGKTATLVHHRDHNRNNNVTSNLESLCKQCHQIEHKCWLNFEGSETIRKE